MIRRIMTITVLILVFAISGCTSKEALADAQYNCQERGQKIYGPTLEYVSMDTFKVLRRTYKYYPKTGQCLLYVVEEKKPEGGKYWELTTVDQSIIDVYNEETLVSWEDIDYDDYNEKIADSTNDWTTERLKERLSETQEENEKFRKLHSRVFQ